MLAAMPTADSKASTAQIALTCAIAFVVLNVFFYFMSTGYFESHRSMSAGAGLTSSYTAAQMTQIRVAFGILTGVLAVSAIVAWLRPRQVGHVIAAMFGAFYIIAAIPAFSRGAPPVLGVTWLVAGSLMLGMVWQSYFHRSRASWAMLVAMCGVLAAAEVFGAPKLARAVDVTLWLAMVLPGLKLIALVALASVRDEYVEGALAAA
jgi:hypothetical protein